MTLITDLHITDVDGIYQQLIELHQGCDDEESARLNCRLILILLNHIGDEATIAEAFALARQTNGKGDQTCAI